MAPEPVAGDLKFPGKAVRLPNGNFLVADSGHHSLVELAEDGERVVRRIGDGERGLVDGTSPASASRRGWRWSRRTWTSGTTWWSPTR